MKNPKSRPHEVITHIYQRSSIFPEKKRDELTRILVAIAWKESEFNPNAIGKEGELGAFQIKAKTGEAVFKSLFIDLGDSSIVCWLVDPGTSSFIAANLLSSLWRKTKSLDETIRMYNQGEGYKRDDGFREIRIHRANQYLAGIKQKLQVINGLPIHKYYKKTKPKEYPCYYVASQAI